LTYWRRRLAKSDRPNRIFDAMRAVIAQTGVLHGKTRRALDSVVLDDAVATQDTITQSIAAIRRVRREVPGAAEIIAVRCHAHDYDDPGKPAIAWDDTQAREALVSALVSDATTIIAALADAELEDQAAQAVALLALIAGQDVEPAQGSDGTDGWWRIARKVAEDRVISTVDPQARHVHKTMYQRQDGYQGHVAVEPDMGLFTGGKLTQAAGEDNHEAVIGLELLDDADGELEVLGDSAYGTGDARAALAQNKHTAVIKPRPLRPAVSGGFTIDEFTVNETSGTVTCLNGLTKHITPKRAVVFGAACCGCPLRQRATASKTGRTLKLHPHDARLRRTPARLARQPAIARGLPAAPAHGRTLDRLANRAEKPLPQTSLPRRPRRRLVAAHPDGRPEPAPPAQPRPHPPRRNMDHRLINSFPTRPNPISQPPPRPPPSLPGKDNDPSPTRNDLTDRPHKALVNLPRPITRTRLVQQTPSRRGRGRRQPGLVGHLTDAGRRPGAPGSLLGRVRLRRTGRTTIAQVPTTVWQVVSDTGDNFRNVDGGGVVEQTGLLREHPRATSWPTGL
jgi:hypothetical protein